MIKWLWQLPQHLLALCILLQSYTKQCEYYSVRHLFNSGISLGNYIIFDSNRRISQTDFKHEQGHQKQSLYLGPLYLLVIGLPSVIGNLLHRIWKFDYYKQPWELWADKLGGVYR